MVEPTIKTRAGVRRPDLIAWRSGECLVVIKSADNAILDREVELKRLYYQIPEITEYAAQAASIDQSAVSYTAVVLNWRGILARESYELLQWYGLLPYECEVFVSSEHSRSGTQRTSTVTRVRRESQSGWPRPSPRGIKSGPSGSREGPNDRDHSPGGRVTPWQTQHATTPTSLFGGSTCRVYQALR